MLSTTDASHTHLGTYLKKPYVSYLYLLSLMLPRLVRAHICLIYKSITYILKNINILISPQYWLKFGNSWPDMTKVPLNIFPHLPQSD